MEQCNAISREISFLQSTICRKNRFTGQVRKLNPMPEDGVVRVVGRSNMTSMVVFQKHPNILQGNHHVAQLMTEDRHRKVGYFGRATTWAPLRQSVELCGMLLRLGKYSVNAYLFKNETSCWDHKSCQAYLSIDLRLSNLRFITVVLIFWCLHSAPGESFVKRYGCIFTCKASRAVDLEVALMVDSFWIHSEGSSPAEVTCTPYLVTTERTLWPQKKELRRILRKRNTNFLSEKLRYRGVRWQFNPGFPLLWILSRDWKFQKPFAISTRFGGI